MLGVLWSLLALLVVGVMYRKADREEAGAPVDSGRDEAAHEDQSSV
jgi:hypothetical protein